MAKKGGLGRGIDALIPQKMISIEPNNSGVEIKDGADTVIYVNISKVEPDPEQPRKNFSDDELNELADSIKTHGIIQPILVQKKDNYYEIVTGERRWRAARIAGLNEIPVIVREFSKKQKIEIQLIENLQREKLNPIEEAEGYKRLLSEFDMTQEELAVNIGKSRTVITNTMRLLNLDKGVIDMLIHGIISAGHARALLSLDSSEEQMALALKIEKDKLSVRDVERLVKRSATQRDKEQKPGSSDSETYRLIYRDLEDKLKSSLSTMVRIQPKTQEKGKIEIEYNSSDELDAIVQAIGKRQ